MSNIFSQMVVKNGDESHGRIESGAKTTNNINKSKNRNDFCSLFKGIIFKRNESLFWTQVTIKSLSQPGIAKFLT